MPHAFAWNIGTTGMMRSSALSPKESARHCTERVQHVRPVRVEHALRVAGGAARVAEARGLALVELGVVEAGLGGGQQLLVVQGVRQRAGVARRPSPRSGGRCGTAAPAPRGAGTRLESTSTTESSAWPRCTRSGRRRGARSACGARRPCRARPDTPPGARACSRRRWPRARPASRPVRRERPGEPVRALGDLGEAQRWGRRMGTRTVRPPSRRGARASVGGWYSTSSRLKDRRTRSTSARISCSMPAA